MWCRSLKNFTYDGGAVVFGSVTGMAKDTQIANYSHDDAHLEGGTCSVLIVCKRVVIV